jgi:hypothetical protein
VPQIMRKRATKAAETLVAIGGEVVQYQVSTRTSDYAEACH